MIFAYDKDKIYFACTYDSLYDKQYQCPTEENLPCWHPHEGMLIYVNTNKPRIADLVRYLVKVPTELSFETIRHFYEDVWEVLQKNGYTNEEAYTLDFTIANAHEAYYLTKNGITDRDDKLTVVSGSMLPELAASLPKDLSPIERLKAYQRLENEYCARQNLPILLLSTDKAGVTVVDI